MYFNIITLRHILTLADYNENDKQRVAYQV